MGVESVHFLVLNAGVVLVVSGIRSRCERKQVEKPRRLFGVRNFRGIERVLTIVVLRCV